MTNELIEAIPSPLWLITKPGGYKHINQFGRVYRTCELALRHCDVNEMVVELRLAPAPEPGAVSPDQALRGMAVYADEVPPIPASAPSAAEAETPQSRSLFDMADTLIREMRKQNMWGMRSEYDNWTLRITRNEPGADNLHGGKARLACGCIDICTNQRDHDAHSQKSGGQARE